MKMNKYIKSELLKNEKSFTVKMLVLVPIVCVVLAFLIMTGSYVQILAYNWWYILFLPFILAYVCAYLIRHDRKKNFHGLLGIIQDKSSLGYGKVITATMYLAITNGIFFVLIGLVGAVFEMQISIVDNLLASVVLTITYAWQIPFFMMLAIKTNLFVSIMVSVVCNFGFACLCATESVWWVPFAIPARLMCHVVGILPNGLLVEAGNSLGGDEIVAGGILITIVLYIAITFIFGKMFAKQEV